ncbi:MULTISPECIES: hypothetical protein [unclassified Pseudomonas]|uniref:Uncharacterized protein n=1 Tax=Pseudomonas sp. MYb327 TaxID=2745230 RepID=A0AAU8E6C3_9PSED
MHITFRTAGFSLMTMFVSCGVGAQEMDTRIDKITMEGERPPHVALAKLIAPTEACFDKRWKLDDITAVE